MFYCEECRVKNKWPNGFVKSYGKCEVCNGVATCSDVPSRALPIPIKKALEPKQ